MAVFKTKIKAKNKSPQEPTKIKATAIMTQRILKKVKMFEKKICL